MQKTLKWFIANFDTAIAIAVCIAAALFSTFNVFQAAVLPAICGGVGLLALSAIRDRDARDTLVAEVGKLTKALSASQSRPSADQIFITGMPEMSLISKAHYEVWIVQETGSKVIEDSFKALVSFIQRGGKVKVLVASNNPTVAEMIAFRSKNLKTENILSRQKEAQSKFASLCEAVKSASGILEIKMVDYPLDITGVYIDPNADDRTLPQGLLRMVGFNNFFDDKRGFLISFAHDPDTYQFFVQQFIDLWNKGKG